MNIFLIGGVLLLVCSLGSFFTGSVGLGLGFLALAVLSYSYAQLAE